VVLLSRGGRWLCRQRTTEKHHDELADGEDPNELPSLLTKSIDEALELHRRVLRLFSPRWLGAGVVGRELLLEIRL
jgi:hypothetical protein